MKTFNVKIRGVSPLLMHRNSPEMDELLRKMKNNEAKQKTEHENYLLYAYMQNEKFYIPSIMLLRCMVEAAKEFRQEGKGKKTYKNIVGGGFVIIKPDQIFLECSPPQPDVQYVKVQNNRVQRTRPRFDSWSAEFTLKIADGINPEIIEDILRYAGVFHGIGDFRPNRGGPYGRFEVEKFEPAHGGE